MTKSRVKNVNQWMTMCLSAAVLTSGASTIAIAQTQQNFNQDVPAQTAPAAPATQEAAPTGQRLPNDFAQQQLPNAFPLGDEETAPAQSGQIIPAPQAATATNASPAAEASAGQQAPQSNGVNQQPAQVPAEPAATNLVPSTQMGVQTQTAAPAPQTGNSVEDAAAAADIALQAEREATVPANVLDEWNERAAPAEDDLPEVNNSTMVRLQTDGFGNAATRNVTVGIEGEESPEAQEKLQEGIRQDAFDAAITGMFPLSPEQIKTLLGRYDRTQKAVEEPVYDAPKPEVSVTNISLDPGVMPPVLKTAVGNVTTVNILDATGAPWPVQDVTWAGDFEIVEPEEGGHIIRITPVAQHARGNIVIRLLTLKTPITMTLETSREVVQYRVDARVPEYGPFAQAPLMQGGKSLVAGDSTLTTLLDGVAPSGAVKLDVSGVDGRTTAYLKGGQTFVRTPLTLLSPAWQSSVTSADGMNVYVLSSAPVLLLSDEGEFMRASLKEKEELLDE